MSFIKEALSFLLQVIIPTALIEGFLVPLSGPDSWKHFDFVASLVLFFTALPVLAIVTLAALIIQAIRLNRGYGPDNKTE